MSFSRHTRCVDYPMTHLFILPMSHNVKRLRLAATNYLLQYSAPSFIRHVGLLILVACISLSVWAVPQEMLAQPLTSALGHTVALANDSAQGAVESACANHQSKMKCDQGSSEHPTCQIQCAQAGASPLPRAALFAAYVFDAEIHTASRAMLLPGIVLPPEIRPPIA